MTDSFFRLIGRTETVWTDSARALSLTAAREPRAELVDLLQRVPFGSEGIRYRRLGVADQLARLPDAVYLSLEHRDRLVGVYAVSAGRLTAGGVEIVGLYRGLLGVDPAAQGTGLGRELVTRTLAWLERQALERGETALSYGCIERSNTRSLTLLRSMGAREIATLHTLSVYRQWPRCRLAADVMSESERGAVVQALASSQADCGLRHTAISPDRYFAVTDESGIVVGASASITRVALERIGGVWDWMSRTLFRAVPAARRRFDPHDFAYLRLNDVVARPGHEYLWPDFLSSLLAEHGVHMAMFALDPRASLTARLAEAGLFGRITATLRQEVAVLATAWNLEDGSLHRMAAQPIGLAPPDL